jgi:dipeptidyl aminopeptidase/acylaminoacyl peptidase
MSRVFIKVVLPLLLLTVCFVVTGSLSAADEKAKASSHLTGDHYFKLGSVSDPQLNSKGTFIAYTVSRKDLEEDESRSRIWMVNASGGDPVAMTAKDQSSSHPRWSPDGRYLAFLSARYEG